MAQLIVVAEATSGGEESPGTSSKFEGPIIAVSVTKTDGTPVTGLAYKNFTLHFLQGGSSVELNSFVPLSIMDIKKSVPGVYVLVPETPSAIPEPGEKNIYSVAVATAKRAGDHGQT